MYIIPGTESYFISVYGNWSRMRIYAGVCIPETDSWWYSLEIVSICYCPEWHDSLEFQMEYWRRKANRVWWRSKYSTGCHSKEERMMEYSTIRSQRLSDPVILKKEARPFNKPFSCIRSNCQERQPNGKLCRDMKRSS